MSVHDHGAIFDKTTGWELSIDKTKPPVTARVKVPTTSLWFDGHFPGEPILPGIAQLNLVMTVLKKALGPAITAARFNRVRFKRLIRPGNRLFLELRPVPKDARSFTFRIICGIEPALTGSVTISEKNQSS